VRFRGSGEPEVSCVLRAVIERVRCELDV
jgi:hypothetical protein